MPIIGSEYIYFNSAHGKASPVLAIRKDASGDITLGKEETTNEFVKWSKPRGGAYMGTMLLYNGFLYNARWNGRLTCYDALTGEEMYSEKAGSGNSNTASPVNMLLPCLMLHLVRVTVILLHLLLPMELYTLPITTEKFIQ